MPNSFILLFFASLRVLRELRANQLALRSLRGSRQHRRSREVREDREGTRRTATPELVYPRVQVTPPPGYSDADFEPLLLVLLCKTSGHDWQQVVSLIRADRLSVPVLSRRRAASGKSNRPSRTPLYPLWSRGSAVARRYRTFVGRRLVPSLLHAGRETYEFSSSMELLPPMRST